MFPLN